jgi:L-iditol 2-dehydrogenase
VRAAAITGPGRVDLVDVPDPQAHGDLVVVRVLVAPLCTEFKSRAAGEAGDRLGHEAAGVVVDAGSSTTVAVGDRVVVMPQNACGRCWLCQRGDHIYCRNQRDVLAESGSRSGLGTVAEYLLKPDYLLITVPDDLTLEQAAMACCGFGPTFTAHRRIVTRALETVVVSGCGAVGLGAVAQGRTLGARVIGIETSAYRAELARRLGAAEVIDPRVDDPVERILELTDGRGAHSGIETSGAPPAAAVLGRSVRVGGRVAVVAWTPQTTFAAMPPGGLEIHGVWHWNHQRHLDEMWTVIRAGRDRIADMITHRRRLDEVNDAMDLQDRGECGKIVLLPFGNEAAA